LAATKYPAMLPVAQHLILDAALLELPGATKN